jgi:hypothetical protein
VSKRPHLYQRILLRNYVLLVNSIETVVQRKLLLLAAPNDVDEKNVDTIMAEIVVLEDPILDRDSELITLS